LPPKASGQAHELPLSTSQLRPERSSARSASPLSLDSGVRSGLDVSTSCTTGIVDSFILLDVGVISLVAGTFGVVLQAGTHAPCGDESREPDREDGAGGSGTGSGAGCLTTSG